MNRDRLFEKVSLGSALIVFFLVVLIGLMLLSEGFPALRTIGIRFPFSDAWNPVSGNFGALPFIFGTLVSSALALVIAVPLSLGIAMFLSELAPRFMRVPIATLIEILAAIPSVIYGLWGIFFLAPWLRETGEPILGKTLGFLPLFQGPPYGIGMLAAGVILAIMIIPIISSITRDIFLAVPNEQREAALALGATRWETTKMAVFRMSRPGVAGAIFLGLGRALGETMAVTMVIGNRPDISLSLFAPGATMASIIANEFTEATDDLHLSALFALGLTLFLVTFVINAGARWLVTKTVGVPFGGRS